MQLRLENQVKVQPIGHVSSMVIDVEGMKKYVDFDFIEVVDVETLISRYWGLDGPMIAWQLSISKRGF